MDKYIITPKSKVADVLNNYPELEDVFLDISPDFAKLKNPILRNTVAKIASLEQAAMIAKIPVAEIVNRLRKEVGQSVEEFQQRNIAVNSDDFNIEDFPIVEKFDAREMIQSGEHPLEYVMNGVNKINQGEIFELITPFVPFPLIEIASKKGVVAKINDEDPNKVRIYFLK